MDEEKVGWRRDIYKARHAWGWGGIWEDPARLSVKKLPFLYFPHILHLQMKQKHKVSCHNKDVESADKEVHLESEKELTETPAAGGEKSNLQITDWIYNKQAVSVIVHRLSFPEMLERSRLMKTWQTGEQKKVDATEPHGQIETSQNPQPEQFIVTCCLVGCFHLNLHF